jgi:hypothetical protein
MDDTGQKAAVHDNHLGAPPGGADTAAEVGGTGQPLQAGGSNQNAGRVFIQGLINGFEVRQRLQRN